jgi:Gpi18-like mannosyltransferase
MGPIDTQANPMQNVTRFQEEKFHVARQVVFSRWLVLGTILLLAFITRIGYTPYSGYAPDLGYMQRWISIIENNGLFKFYNFQTPTDMTYPPGSALVMGSTLLGQRWLIPNHMNLSDSQYVASLKIPGVIADLLIISAVFLWLFRDDQTLKNNKWQLLIPALLAILPMLVIDSAWWGQVDSIYTLLVVLALIALNKDKPYTAWLFLTLGILAKQQALVITPLLVILTYRRYGWRKLLAGMAIAAGVFFLIYSPFILTSGLDKAMATYFAASNVHTVASANALNFWVTLGEITGIKPDTVRVLGPLTFRHIGYILLVLYVLPLSVMMWRYATERREFLWAAALYFGAFSFLTQMHERYLLPGAVLVLIATANNKRLWPLALISAFTTSYNMMQIAVQFRWLAIDFWGGSLSFSISILNTLLTIEILYLSIARTRQPIIGKLPAALRKVVDGLLLVNRVLIGGIIFGILATLIFVNIYLFNTAHWIATNTAQYSHVVVDDHTDTTWDAITSWPNGHLLVQIHTPNIESRHVQDWYASGNHYLLIHEQASPVNFQERIRSLESQGAMLRYLSPGISFPGFGVYREALLWTFRPQTIVNANFNDDLLLVGYDTYFNSDSQPELLLYWFSQRNNLPTYSFFLRRVDENGTVAAFQPDSPVGSTGHFTETWQTSEIFFEHVPIASTALAKLPAQLRMGLYETNSGNQAKIKGTKSGDEIVIDFPAPR